MSEAPPPLSPGWALFLDVDGTLLEHAPHPEGVRVEPRLRILLSEVMRACGGALALISGRSLADLDRLFAPMVFPAAGQHGTERRAADGSMQEHAPTSDQMHNRLQTTARTLTRLAAAHPGLVAENKGMSVALHYRLAPSLESLAERAMGIAIADLGDDFELQAGKFVFEIRPGGRDKGSAIAEFMAEPPFNGRVPAFVGDDLTDEYGFALVNARGGHSIKVGAGQTAARWRLPGAAAVHEWLAAALRAGGVQRPGETA